MLLKANKRQDFLLSESALDRKHTLIAGITDSGKSHAAKIMSKGVIEKGGRVLYIDSADEHSDTCQFFPADVLVVVDPKDLKINFLTPPPGVDPVIWRGILINIFREGMFLRDGSCNELNSILASLAATKMLPAFPDLHMAIMSKSYRAGSRKAGYIETLQNRSEMLLNSYIAPAFMCVEGHPLEEVIIRRSCVLRVGKISSDLVRNFYVNFILKWIETYLTFNPQERGDNPRVIVIEEVHRYYGAQQRSDLREPIILSLAREIRKCGVSLIFVDQIVSLLPKQMLGNVYTFIIFRLVNASCIKAISEICNLYPDQKEMLSELPKQTAMVRSGELSQPYLIRTIDFSVPKVSDEYIKAKMEPFFASLPWTPIPGTEEEVDELYIAGGIEIESVSSKKIELRPRKIWKDILKIIDEEKFISQTQLYEKTGISPYFCRRLVKEMESLGMIELVTLGFGKRGNPTSFLLLKDKASEFLGKKPEDLRLPGKGSPAHILSQNLLARKMKESGKNVMVEYSMNGKSVDIAEFAGNSTIAYEIEMEPNDHVAENIRRDLEAGFDKVVVISNNAALQNEIRDKAYQGVDWIAMTKVDFKLVREFL